MVETLIVECVETKGEEVVVDWKEGFTLVEVESGTSRGPKVLEIEKETLEGAILLVSC